MLVIRPARTSDVKAIRQLVDSYAAPGKMLTKETVTLYEGVQEFTVAEEDGVIVGCGALHILWEDLAEVRTVAVEQSRQKEGIGNKILEKIIERAREVGVNRIFCLTFQTEFKNKSRNLFGNLCVLSLLLNIYIWSFVLI